MIIRYTPQVRYDDYVAIVSGDFLVIDGVYYDFSFMNEGDKFDWRYTDCKFFAGEDIERVGGEIVLTLINCIPRSPSDKDHPSYSAGEIQVVDGPVVFPKPEEPQP